MQHAQNKPVTHAKPVNKTTATCEQLGPSGVTNSLPTGDTQDIGLIAAAPEVATALLGTHFAEGKERGAVGGPPWPAGETLRDIPPLTALRVVAWTMGWRAGRFNDPAAEQSFTRLVQRSQQE